MLSGSAAQHERQLVGRFLRLFMARNVFDDPLVVKALGSSRREFRRLRRRAAVQGTLVYADFFQHLFEVAQLVAEAGFGPDVVAASLLHDHLEDLPGWSESRLEREFGSGAAGLVVWTTHENKKLPLSSRNELYFAKLRLAPESALAIVCADRISNMSSYNSGALSALLEEDARDVGWSGLPGPWPHAVQAYERLFTVLKGKVPPHLLERYEEALDSLVRAASAQRLDERAGAHSAGTEDEASFLLEATRGRVVLLR